MRHRRLLVAFADLAAADLADEVAIDHLHGALERGGIDVAETDVEPGEGANMGDPAAHLAGADDADRLHHDRSNRLLAFRQLGVELRYQLEEVTDEAVIGNLEDRRLLVLVDGDDDLGILHPGEMLDAAGDADRDVEIGGDDPARLADLVVVGHEAGIDGAAAGADGGSELVAALFQALAIVAR